MRQVSRWQRAIATLAVIAGLIPAVPLAAAGGQDSGKLKVSATYTGHGTVDATHQIFVWVFDTPDINGSTTPLAVDKVTANGGSVDFTGLPKTVYLAAAYNEKGTYDGTQGPPPTGTPVTIYGGEGSAKAVTTGGADAAVAITFDDAMRMP